ncbi:ABC transporter ATP-binding protein [Nesterenkonia salmonea]|uniref:ABC transporter ATP-binding protein n=2 Tax=Nesterenkonia salmonea TaxID=1804987 RepID=A0A5R9BLR1_9MICC|nr:ABC transporter ATP-binding protein [Nesterenkonia salmonea]
MTSRARQPQASEERNEMTAVTENHKTTEQVENSGPVHGAELVATNVNKVYSRAGQKFHAVEDVSVTIKPGEFVCIVGPSGCGKSTMMNMATGLLEPTDGELALDGEPIRGPSPDRGLVFQKDSVFPWMKVIDNVTYGLKCRGVPKEERMSIARKFLAEVNLTHVEKSWPKELSGGMLKRVAIATAFSNAPKLLLMDEPFASVDYVTRLQLQKTVLDLWAEHRLTVMFVTHDVDEALTLADRIIVMTNGRVVDDRRVAAERPRRLEALSTPTMLEHKASMLQHLGLPTEGGA